MSIHLSNTSFGYQKDQIVLRELNLTIDRGQCVLMTGPNGAGKSTILKLLNGILKPGSGSITVDELDTASTPTPVLASHIAVTFQNPADQIFASTVRDEVLFGPKLLRRSNPTGLADESLKLFGLHRYASNHPYDLSPADRRLLTIASAVATDSPILAFDEPTTSLSQPERTILLNAMKELRRKGRTLIIVSHDLEFFLDQSSLLVVVSGGRIVHTGKPNDIVENRRLAKSAGILVPISLRIRKITGSGATRRE